MNRIRNGFAIVCLVMSAAGCSTFTVDKKAWIGKPESELISDWGKPAGKSPDGKGGSIIIYRSTMKPAYFQNSKQDTSSGKYAVFRDVIVRITIFYLNEKGTIYQVESTDKLLYNGTQAR